MSRVVGRWRADAESCRRGGLDKVSSDPESLGRILNILGMTYMIGLFGAVVKGVSVRAAPLARRCFAPVVGAAKLPSEGCVLGILLSFSFSISASSGVLAPSVLGVEK